MLRSLNLTFQCSHQGHRKLHGGQSPDGRTQSRWQRDQLSSSSWALGHVSRTLASTTSTVTRRTIPDMKSGWRSRRKIQVCNFTPRKWGDHNNLDGSSTYHFSLFVSSRVANFTSRIALVLGGLNHNTERHFLTSWRLHSKMFWSSMYVLCDDASDGPISRWIAQLIIVCLTVFFNHLF